MLYCICKFYVSAIRFVCVNILSFQVEVLLFRNAINVLYVYAIHGAILLPEMEIV